MEKVAKSRPFSKYKKHNFVYKTLYPSSDASVINVTVVHLLFNGEDFYLLIANFFVTWNKDVVKELVVLLWLSGDI